MVFTLVAISWICWSMECGSGPSWWHLVLSMVLLLVLSEITVERVNPEIADAATIAD